MASGVFGPSKLAEFIADNWLFLHVKNGFCPEERTIQHDWMLEYSETYSKNVDETTSCTFPSWLKQLGFISDTFIEENQLKKNPDQKTKPIRDNIHLIIRQETDSCIVVLPLYSGDVVVYMYSEENFNILKHLKLRFLQPKNIESSQLEDILFARQTIIQRRQQNPVLKWKLRNLLDQHIQEIKQLEKVKRDAESQCLLSTLNIRIPTSISTKQQDTSEIHSPVFNPTDSNSPIFQTHSPSYPSSPQLNAPPPGSPGYEAFEETEFLTSATSPLPEERKINLFQFFTSQGELSTIDDFQFFKCEFSWMIFDTKSYRNFVFCHPYTKKFRLCQVTSVVLKTGKIQVRVLKKNRLISEPVEKTMQLSIADMHGPWYLLYDEAPSIVDDITKKYKYDNEKELPTLFQKEWTNMSNTHHWLEFYYISPNMQWKTSIGMFILTNYVAMFWKNQETQETCFQLLESESIEKSLYNTSIHEKSQIQISCICCNKIQGRNQICFEAELKGCLNNNSSKPVSFFITSDCVQKINYIQQIGRSIRNFKALNYGLFIAKCDALMEMLNRLKVSVSTSLNVC
jgi:hypothetical protein